jgi:hypothetical protein
MWCPLPFPNTLLMNGPPQSTRALVFFLAGSVTSVLHIGCFPSALSPITRHHASCIMCCETHLYSPTMTPIIMSSNQGKMNLTSLEVPPTPRHCLLTGRGHVGNIDLSEAQDEDASGTCLC